MNLSHQLYTITDEWRDKGSGYPIYGWNLKHNGNPKQKKSEYTLKTGAIDAHKSDRSKGMIS